jgi:hypothetical protein
MDRVVITFQFGEPVVAREENFFRSDVQNKISQVLI